MLLLGSSVFKSDKEEIRESKELAKFPRPAMFYTGESREMCCGFVYCVPVWDWYSESDDMHVWVSEIVSGRKISIGTSLSKRSKIKSTDFGPQCKYITKIRKAGMKLN